MKTTFFNTKPVQMKSLITRFKSYLPSKKDIKLFITGEPARGKKIGRPKARIVQVVPKPSFNEWCQQLNVSTRFRKDQAVYYETNS